MAEISLNGLRNMMNHGYLVTEAVGGFQVIKVATVKDSRTDEIVSFDDYDTAYQYVVGQIEDKQLKFFGMIRFNRGMGYEIINLESPICAKDAEEAQSLLKEIAESKFEAMAKTDTWLRPWQEKITGVELKVKPILG